jgi:hypothetical protein
MSCTPPFKRIVVTRAPSAISQLAGMADDVDAGNRWNASAITVGAHARTGRARIDRQRRRRQLAQSRLSGRRYARRTRPLWLMKRRPRHRRFCSIRARSRP